MLHAVLNITFLSVRPSVCRSVRPSHADSNNNNNNSSFYCNSWQSATDTQHAATQDSTDTVEHQEAAIIQPNITTRISMGGRQLQASAKVYHNEVN